MPTSPPNDLCTDGSMWGWWPLTVPLNLAFIHPFDAPNCRQRGAMWVGMATSRAWEAAGEGTSGTSSTSPTTGVEVSGSAPLDSWGGTWEMVVVGARQHFLGWGGVEDMGECDTAPLKSPYRPSATDPATAFLIFCSPCISNCCTSSHSKLACFNKSNPWKKMGSVTKTRLGHSTVKG